MPSIKTRFIAPQAAFTFLRGVGTYPSGSIDIMFSHFCASRGITDQHIRIKALAENTTLTEAVRRLWTSEHPDMLTSWPPKHTSAARVEVSKASILTNSPLQTDFKLALKHIRNLLDNPDSGHVKFRAEDFLNKHAVNLATKENL